MYSNIPGIHSQIQQKFHRQGISIGQSHQQNEGPTREGLYQATAPSGSSYTINNSVHPDQHQVLRHHTFEHQPVYYDAQRRNNNISGLPRNIAATTNTQQPIYVNPTPYGTYTTVQYHQGPPPTYQPNPVVIHPHDPSMSSRFISMPVQGPMPTQVSTNGAYIYFHQPTDTAALNILQPNNRRNQFKAPIKQTNDRARKSGRMKKSDSQDNGASVILEEFRTEKNRSWTAIDVRG